MGSSWYHLLGNDYVRLLILDLVFTFLCAAWHSEKALSLLGIASAESDTFSRLSDLAAFVVMLSLAVRFK